MPIRRVETVMTSSGGSPYFNQLFFRDEPLASAQDLLDLVRAYWDSFKIYMVSGTTTQVQPEVVTLDEDTGEALSFESGSVAVITNTSSGQPAPYATQGVVRLRTDSFLNGRRVQGRIFLPNMVTYAPFVRPSDSQVADFATNTNALIDDSQSFGQLLVWSRPRAATQDAPARSGAVSNVVSADTWTKWGVLRSRRD